MINRTSNQQPATSNQSRFTAFSPEKSGQAGISSTNGIRFASSQIPGVTNNQQPATSNQQPATSNQQPATSNQQPIQYLISAS